MIVAKWEIEGVLYTRKQLSRRYKTRLSLDGRKLLLSDRDTKRFVRSAHLHWCDRGQSLA